MGQLLALMGNSSCSCSCSICSHSILGDSRKGVKTLFKLSTCIKRLAGEGSGLGCQDNVDLELAFPTSCSSLILQLSMFCWMAVGTCDLSAYAILAQIHGQAGPALSSSDSSTCNKEYSWGIGSLWFNSPIHLLLGFFAGQMHVHDKVVNRVAMMWCVQCCKWNSCRSFTISAHQCWKRSLMEIGVPVHGTWVQGKAYEGIHHLLVAPA